jgi:threonine/homoserine efflux transporter RhtA
LKPVLAIINHPYFYISNEALGTSMQNLPIIAVLYMILSMVSYQISASFAKQLIAALDPLTVTILRLCFAQ